MSAPKVDRGQCAGSVPEKPGYYRWYRCPYRASGEWTNIHGRTYGLCAHHRPKPNRPNPHIHEQAKPIKIDGEPYREG